MVGEPEPSTLLVQSEADRLRPRREGPGLHNRKVVSVQLQDLRLEGLRDVDVTGRADHDPGDPGPGKRRRHVDHAAEPCLTAVEDEVPDLVGLQGGEPHPVPGGVVAQDHRQGAPGGEVGEAACGRVEPPQERLGFVGEPDVAARIRDEEPDPGQVALGRYPVGAEGRVGRDELDQGVDVVFGKPDIAVAVGRYRERVGCLLGQVVLPDRRGGRSGRGGFDHGAALGMSGSRREGRYHWLRQDDNHHEEHRGPEARNPRPVHAARASG